MIIKTANYIKGGVKKTDFPNLDMHEFMFCGRSNVGKSSIINMILERKNLAYTSQKPGKTQVINFFNINESFILVDVPGYGYAINKGKIDGFGKMFDEYILDRKNLKVVFLLIDSKVGVTEDDLLMYNYLSSLKINIKIIATKKDKLNQSELYHSKKNILNTLKFLNEDDIIYTSSVKKFGRDKILKIIEENI